MPRSHRFPRRPSVGASLRRLAIVTLLATAAAHAAPPAPPTPLTPPTPPAMDATARRTVVDTLADRLEKTYVDQAVAAALARHLRDQAAQGGYDKDADVEAFADHLTRELRESGHDLHFVVHHDPSFHERPADAPSVPSAEEAAEMRADTLQQGFGIARVQRLPGNVGYIDLRGFPPLQYVAAAYAHAMSLLSGTDALVVDLRRNGGGEPQAVAGFMSHFFAEGDDRHLNDIWWRTTNRTDESWTSEAAAPRYLQPVFVLTSKFTFSGGEECAYDFQTQKRATLVGDTTGGGANPGDPVSIGAGFVAFIPSGRAINPVTHTNWEHVGVKPDVAVPAADAMKTAYVALLKQLAQAAPAERQGDFARWRLQAESGQLELPGFVAPRLR